MFAPKDLLFARSQFVVLMAPSAIRRLISGAILTPISCDSSRTVAMWAERTCDSSLGCASILSPEHLDEARQSLQSAVGPTRFTNVTCAGGQAARVVRDR